MLEAPAEAGAECMAAHSDQQPTFCVLSPSLLPQMEASLRRGSAASLSPVLRCAAPAADEDYVEALVAAEYAASVKETRLLGHARVENGRATRGQPARAILAVAASSGAALPSCSRPPHLHATSLQTLRLHTRQTMCVAPLAAPPSQTLSAAPPKHCCRLSHCFSEADAVRSP